MKIIKLIQQKTNPNQYRLDGPVRLRFNLPTHDIKDRITLLEKLLNELM